MQGSFKKTCVSEQKWCYLLFSCRSTLGHFVKVVMTVLLRANWEFGSQREHSAEVRILFDNRLTATYWQMGTTVCGRTRKFTEMSTWVVHFMSKVLATMYEKACKVKEKPNQDYNTRCRESKISLNTCIKSIAIFLYRR